MDLVAFIPAKGTNERFPGKNLYPFLGKPLIEHTIDFLLRPELGEVEIWVVSDDDAICDFGKSKGCKVFKTPAGGKAILDVRKAFWSVQPERFPEEYVVGMFLPTAPLRQPEHLIEGLREIQLKGADRAVSVTPFEFPPSLALVKDQFGGLHSANPTQPFINDDTRSQDQPKFLRPNGMFYLSVASRFAAIPNFFEGRVHGVEVPRALMVDIDYKEDLELAEWRASRV